MKYKPERMLQKMLSCSAIDCTTMPGIMQTLLSSEFLLTTKVSVEKKPFPRIRMRVSIFVWCILSDLRYLPAMLICITEVDL